MLPRVIYARGSLVSTAEKLERELPVSWPSSSQSLTSICVRHIYYLKFLLKHKRRDRSKSVLFPDAVLSVIGRLNIAYIEGL
jgi:hypothetical protein